MKGKWKLCVISGSLLVFTVLGALLLLNGTMSSADEKLKTFDASSQSVSGSAAAGKVQKKEQVKEKKEDSSGEIITSFEWSKDDNRKIGHKIAKFAEFWEGVRYEYGGAVLPEVNATGYIEEGKGPDPKKGRSDGRGVDSSGFIQAVYYEFDIGLPRSCKEQAQIGESVRIKDIMPGDLIFYGASDDKVTHAGIYIGKGKVIHSSSKVGKVIISDMNYRRIVSVRRIIGAIIPKSPTEESASVED